MSISGKFSVQLKPQVSYAEGIDGVTLNRLSLDKEFFGPLAATSQGEMLSAMTTESGSAGYVAIEQVSGVLEGKQGSFVLQHFGIMHKAAEHLALQVLPDSGAGELVGLNGNMTIEVKQGEHFYEFDYQLPD